MALWIGIGAIITLYIVVRIAVAGWKASSDATNSQRIIRKKIDKEVRERVKKQAQQKRAARWSTDSSKNRTRSGTISYDHGMTDILHQQIAADNIAYGHESSHQGHSVDSSSGGRSYDSGSSGSDSYSGSDSGSSSSSGSD